MLNSVIFEKYGYDLQQEVNERYQEIFDYYFSFWDDDSIFDGYYRNFFPNGYIDRNREKAKQVLWDLSDIIYSSVIRDRLATIYIYVMRSMIEHWYIASTDYELDILPDSVKEYIKNVDEEQAEYIKRWFTDVGACIDDFEEAYNAEFLFEDFAEAIALRVLDNPVEIGGIEEFGISFTDLLDLLPNDLYDRVIKLRRFEDPLTRKVLVALEKLCNRAWDYKDFSENGLNRQVRDFLDDGSYSVLDQAQQGVSVNGKEEGSLDILIKDRGLNVAIYEGLIHKDKRYLIEHINKATGRYNPSGCRSIYIGEYYRVNNFDNAWRNCIKELQGEEIDTGRDGIRLYKLSNVWIFGINMSV